VVQVPVLLVGGSQFPFTHTQFDAGLTVVQLPMLPVFGGSQPPLTQTQFDAG
jgi:hypothetical protein